MTKLLTKNKTIYVATSLAIIFSLLLTPELINAADIVDTEPPITTTIFTPASPDGENGWYSSEVTVTLTVTDNLSGVVYTEYSLDNGQSWLPYTGSFVITESSVILARSIDNSGNVEIPVLCSCSTVKIDMAPPEITITSPETRVYLNSDMLTLIFSATDFVSGVAGVDASLDGLPVYNGEIFDLFFFNLDEHTMTARAEDVAGNDASEAVAFNVIATIPSTIECVEHAEELGLIDNAGITNSLVSKLESAEKSMSSGKEDTAGNQLNAFINHLEAQQGKHVTTEAADILIKDAQFIK